MSVRERTYLVLILSFVMGFFGVACAILLPDTERIGFLATIFLITIPFLFILFFNTNGIKIMTKTDFFNHFIKDYQDKIKEIFKLLKIKEFYSDLSIITFFNIITYTLLYPLLSFYIIFILNIAYIEILFCYYIYVYLDKIIDQINRGFNLMLRLFNINISKRSFKSPIKFNWISRTGSKINKNISINNNSASKIIDEINKSKKDH